MVELTVTILGCGSAKPTLRHHTSSQILSHSGKLYMIDCGEGTQTQFLRYGFHPGQLEHIFISHAHGDHCLGLVGLLSSLSLDKRTTDINLHVPSDFVDILKAQIDFFVTHADFDIRIHPIDTQEPTLIFSDQHFDVTAIPLEHRVPCYGFLFREKQGSRHIIPECIRQYAIPRTEIERIRGGEDFTTGDGQVIPNEVLTTPPNPARSYAYLSDTRPVMRYADLLQGVDLIYHDATYCEGDEELARKYDHSTAAQAAEFAKACGAGKLLIGHFSSRYKSEDCFLECATRYFPDVILADEGVTVKITTTLSSPPEGA